MIKYFLFLFIFLGLCGCFGTHFTGIDEIEKNEFVWEFCSIKKSDASALEDDISYDIHLKEITTKGSDYFFEVRKSKLKAILKFFKKSTIEDLKGKVFRSKEISAKSAFEKFHIDIINDFKYKIPTPEEIFDILAKSLAKMKAPDYSKFRKKDVHNAYITIFNKNGFIKQEWIKNLKRKLKDISKDKIIIVRYHKYDIFKRNTVSFYLVSNEGEKKAFTITNSIIFNFEFDY